MLRASLKNSLKNRVVITIERVQKANEKTYRHADCGIKVYINKIKIILIGRRAENGPY